MKKNILFVAAALFLFLGNQSLSAQAQFKNENTQTKSTEKTELVASNKTQSLVRALGLNEKQQEQVYSLFQKTEEKMNRANAVTESKDLGAKQAKMDKYIMAKMKEILTEDQYTKYLDLLKKP